MRMPAPAVLRRMMADAETAWQQACSPVEEFETIPPLRYITTVAQRQGAWFKAIRHLAQVDEHVSASIVILRSLVEESVWLEYLSRQTERERYGFVAYRQCATHQDCRSDLNYIVEVRRERNEDPSDLLAMMEQLEEYRQKVTDYSSRRGYDLSSSPTLRDMAEAIGRHDDVVAYGWMNQFVHGTFLPVTQTTATCRHDGAGPIHPNLEQSATALPFVAVTATRSLMRSFIATAAMAGWAVPVHVPKMLAMANIIQKAVDDDEPSAE